MYSIRLQINGDVIEVTRATSADRATTYATYNNTFRPEVLNKDIDRIWLKIQELGVADALLKFYTDKLHIEQKGYIDNQDQVIRQIVNDLRNYVDTQDNARNTYFTSLIYKQGVALDQLDDYYNSLMQQITKIVVDKGWDSSFVADGDTTQKEINKLLRLHKPEYYRLSTDKDDIAMFERLVATNPQKIELTAGKIYDLGTTTLTLPKSCIVEGNGATIKVSGNNIGLTPKPMLRTKLTTLSDKGATTVTVTDIAGFNVR